LTDAPDYLIHIHDRDVETLIEGYLMRRKGDVTAAREALEEGDFDRLARLGHNLHGSGGAYGIPQLSRVGRDLERAAQVAVAAEVEALIVPLEGLLARVRII
jgi:HPt (histidine-containing phosphotransfer) domain-containing protein